MARLLYVESSPRKDRSASVAVARAFVDEYLRTHPDDGVDTLDLWAEDLPPFDGMALDAKYRILYGKSPGPEHEEAWGAVRAVIDRFTAADKYLFSLPMWNFGVPYRLKHYVDVLVQPTYTFSFSPKEGYRGLVTGKPAAVVYARGGAYPPGTPGEGMDFQKRYVELVLGFIGFTDVRPIVVEPTLGKPDAVAATVEAAKEAARRIAAAF